MTLEQLMIEQSEKYRKLIEKISKELEKAPEGTLFCKKEGNYYKWYQNFGHGRKMKYIPKKDRKLAQALAFKMVRKNRLQDAVKEKFAVDQYLKHHNFSMGKLERFLQNANGEMSQLIRENYQPLPEKYEKWQKAEYPINPAYPEKRRIRTLRGDLVRSKSEAMIADFLFTQGIPYRYECPLKLGDRVVYPDFMIIHPITGEMILIEHFGKMDDPEYLDHFLEKIKRYAEHEYYPDGRLLCFFETAKEPLDSASIFEKLQVFLNLRIN